MRAILALSLVVLSGALRRSSSHGRRTAAPYGSMSWKNHFDEYMSDLKQTSNPDGFNQMCNPYVKEPQGTSRGLILLQHGYTACPNFWYLLTPQLLAQGWTVMAPLLPGHGRMPRIQANASNEYTVTDYAADLPQRGTEYEQYSKELIEIAQKYKKDNRGNELVLNGISHGGAVAVYMAMNGEVGIWDRVMLMNPFLSPPTALGADFGISFLRDIIPQVLPAFKFMNNSVVREGRMHWGDDCDHKRWPSDPRNGGTGGICQFELENFRAVLEFGNTVEGEARVRAAEVGVFTGGVVDRLNGVRDLVRHNEWKIAHGVSTPPSNLRVQLLTTSMDASISNARVHFLAQALQNMVAPESSGYCALDAEFGHTFINPPDKPVDLDMWYLNASRVEGGKSIVDLLADFLAEGKVMPVNGIVEDDKALLGDPRCDVSQKL